LPNKPAAQIPSQVQEGSRFKLLPSPSSLSLLSPFSFNKSRRKSGSENYYVKLLSKNPALCGPRVLNALALHKCVARRVASDPSELSSGVFSNSKHNGELKKRFLHGEMSTRSAASSRGSGGGGGGGAGALVPMESGVKSMDSKHVPLLILRCKLVIVGDACVGKSALTQVFHSGGSTYPKNYLMTVGAEFCVKQVPIPDTNAVVELYVFDCAGQSIFNHVEMNAKYYENASAVMVVYDISSNESLNSCNKWLTSVRALRPMGPPLLGTLVGNKCELRDGQIDTRAEVVREDASRMAQDLGLAYFETSASSHINVDAPFKFIAEEFYKRYEDTVARAEEMGP